MQTNMQNGETRGEIVIYRAKDGRTSLEVNLHQETVWLTQAQMINLFQRDQSVISRHIHNVFKEGELHPESNMQKTHIAGSDKPVMMYSLDMIISIGYRVNSRRGTEFRIWATQVLKDHILKGYTVNEKRLREQATRFKELQEAVNLMGRIMQDRQLAGNEAEGLLKIVTDYSLALSLLDQYDHQQLALCDITLTTSFVLTYELAKKAIAKLAEQSSFVGGLFGQEKDDSFKSSIAAIYQTFGGRELYPSIEEKAAHLLYFVIKNHSFTDGNKRIAAFLNALVALTLMIAESKPKDKNIIVKVLVNLINRENV